MEIFALAPLSSPLQGPGRPGRSRKFGRGTGDRKNFCWGAVDFSSKKDQDQDAQDGHENLAEAPGTEKTFCWGAVEFSSKKTRTRTPPTVTKIWQRHRGPNKILLGRRWLLLYKHQDQDATDGRVAKAPGTEETAKKESAHGVYWMCVSQERVLTGRHAPQGRVFRFFLNCAIDIGITYSRPFIFLSRTVSLGEWGSSNPVRARLSVFRVPEICTT